MDLTTTSGVYVTDTSITSSGYYLMANKISIVTLGNSTVSLKSGTTGNCALSDVLLCAGYGFASHFEWYEGNFIGKINLGNGAGASYNRFHKLHLQAQLYVDDQPRGTITQSYLNSLFIDDADHWLFEDVVGNGIVISGDSSYGADVSRMSGHLIQVNQGQWSPLHVTGVSAKVFSPQNNPSYVKGTYNLLATDGTLVFMNNASPTVSQAYLAGGIQAFNTTNSKFSGLIVFSTATPTCTIFGGTNVGIDANCDSAGSSNFTEVTRAGSVWANSFNGFISTDDSQNSSDVNGSASYASISDWFSFESFFRIWSETTSAQCTSNCGIYDWRLKSTDTLFRNTTSDGVNQNDAFVAGATCPAAVHGNKTATNQETSAKTYLLAAMEISNDEIGNDNTLCETNEECIYAPNFGGYQGYGDVYAAGTCTFQDGSVSGVKMYAFPNM